MVVLENKLRTYKVDLDYEAFLFAQGYQEQDPSNLKIIREFEYVFFLINKEKCIFKNIKSYEKSYLDYLKKLGFFIPELNANAPSYEYWWGHRENKDLMRMLNSKLTSAKIAVQNNWGFKEGAIVKSLDDLKIHLDKFQHVKKWIIKHPNSFSGIGHYQFRAEAFDELILSKYLSEEVLLEPVYDRVFDIGTTYEIEDGVIKRHFMVLNFNSEKGNFKGGAGASDVDKFKKYIGDKFDFALEELEKITKSIVEIYINLGAVSNIQIDSFIYRENGELKLYPLVEVNYRKTMGLVIQSLAEKNPDANWIEWRIESNKNLKIHPIEVDWIKLSPDGNVFQSYLKYC
jgi:hypothetical protein